MLLETPVPLAVGEELELEFCLPDNPAPLKPRVQVVRKAARSIGVKFVTLTIEARESIRQFTGVKVKASVA